MSKSIKVTVIGDISVGKTSILERYIKNTFCEFSESTIGAAFSVKRYNVQNIGEIRLEIWDTAGQERYSSLLPMYYRGANVILLVFDLNNPDSVKSIKNRWVPILNDCENDVQIYLVGNKCDLEQLVNEYQLSEFNKLKYFKVSAKKGIGINHLFDCIVNNVVSNNNFYNPKKSINISKQIEKKDREYCTYDRCC